MPARAAHPILGDATHGKGPLNRWWAEPERLGQARLWLHAQSLTVPHPATGLDLELVCDWSALQARVPDAADWLRLQQCFAWQPVATM